MWRIDHILIALLLIGLICLLVLGVTLCAWAEKPLYNYDVPLHGCAEKVTLVGCDDSRPMKCKQVRVRFVSETCLMLEAK